MAQEAIGLDPFLRSAEICRTFNVGARGLRKWVHSGRFPPPDANIGGRNLWRLSTVQKHRDAVLAGAFALNRRPGFPPKSAAA
jgi:hypothetical protein